MRFLVDECTGPGVAAWFKSQGHEALSVFDEARGASDASLLRRAIEEGWIVVTNDKGFGEYVHRDGTGHHGVILLRLSDERTANKIAVLTLLMDRHSDQLPGRFVVVSETRVRFSDPPDEG